MKYYFASDVHLGLPPADEHRKRELRFVNWLDSIKDDAEEIFLLGDIFDFWFEYKKVVPKGFIRTLGKIAEITDSGIPVHLFAGNHDLWIGNYLSSELGVIIHPKEYTVNLCGHNFYMAHGDALNTEDKRHMFTRSVFTNKLLQKMFAAIHPYIGLSIAHKWSANNRKTHKDLKFTKENPFYKFAKEKAQKENPNFFVIGHLHTPVHIKDNNFDFIVLPDWLSSGGYAVFDGNKMEIKEIF